MPFPAIARKGIPCATAALMLALAFWTQAFAPTDAPVIDTAPPAVAAEAPLPLHLSLDGPDTIADVADGSRDTVQSWATLIEEASDRFGVPKTWIRAVMARESGGRTCDDKAVPLTSRAGAMGLMQLMPGTYADLRRQYDLGADPYNPHDNIIAGTAYLKWLKTKYGYPGLFAAYNHGPANFDKHLQTGRALPRETREYLAAVTRGLRHGKAARKVRKAEPDLRLASL